MRSLTLVRVLRAVMEHSLTRTQELCGRRSRWEEEEDWKKKSYNFDTKQKVSIEHSRSYKFAIDDLCTNTFLCITPLLE
jgi:hypothetical protein